MTLSIIKRELSNFLASKDSEVLCISGNWGIGKTYAWNDALKKAKTTNKIGLENYSYVSLFGISSIDQFKFSIFQNKTLIENIGKGETSADFKAVPAEKIIAAFLGMANKKNTSLANMISSAAINNTLVCIDDLERKSKGLTIIDIFGLISQLRENKGCKIVLILNNDALDEADQEDFNKYEEKVIDIKLQFDPEPSDSVNIAVQENNNAEYLKQSIITLEITNIRLIRKIERNTKKVSLLVQNLNTEVLREAVNSITVFCWCLYSDNSPSIEYLFQNRRDYYLSSVIDADEKPELNEDEISWNYLLDNVNYHSTNTFDEEL